MLLSGHFPTLEMEMACVNWHLLLANVNTTVLCLLSDKRAAVLN